MKVASAERLYELETRNAELEGKIRKLATVSGVEEEIRSKFSVAKDNENMVIIVREEPATTTVDEPELSFWSKVRNLFR